MKGFFMMVISVALIALLVMFGSVLHENYLSMERALAKPQALCYASFFFDDVADSLRSLIGPLIMLNEGNNSTILAINDTVPRENTTLALAGYESFLEGAFANESHINVDADLSNLSDGRMGLTINERYRYTSDPSAKEMLFTSPGSTDARSYVIVIETNQTRENYSVFDINASGDLPVDLRYTDLNGTITWSGNLSSDQVNRMSINYTNGSSLDLEIGKRSGNSGSLWLRSDNPAAFFFIAELPAVDSNKKFGYVYDADMTYIQNDIRVSRNIGS